MVNPPPGYTETAPHAGQRERQEYHPPTWRMTPEERTQIEAPPDYEVPGDEETPDVAVADEDASEPLPVTIVDSPAPREAWRWSGSRYPINADRATRVAGQDLVRRRIVLHNNDSANSVFLLSNITQPVWSAYQLAPGETLELLHNGDVWAICDTGDTAELSVASEFAYRE